MQLGITQAKLASDLGVGPSTIGNMESQNYVVISEKRAASLADLFGLDEHGKEDLLAAWRELPVLAYTEGQRDRWRKKNEQRAKLKSHEAVVLAHQKALLEIFGELVLTAYTANLELKCDCGPNGMSERDPTRSCELCNAMQVLGLPRWTDMETAVTGLSALQDRLEAKPT